MVAVLALIDISTPANIHDPTKQRPKLTYFILNSRHPLLFAVEADDVRRNHVNIPSFG